MTEKKDLLIQELEKAVALKYSPEEDVAPRVIAKGQGKIAQKIVEEAKAADIMVYEDRNLVESLMGLDLNEEISEELYQAVAEIIFYIYQMDQQRGNKNG